MAYNKQSVSETREIKSQHNEFTSSKDGSITRMAIKGISLIRTLPLLWTTPLSISQRKQEGARNIFPPTLTSPLTWIVSSKFGPILEGDKGDSPINVVTLLMEGGS